MARPSNSRREEHEAARGAIAGSLGTYRSQPGEPAGEIARPDAAVSDPTGGLDASSAK